MGDERKKPTSEEEWWEARWAMKKLAVLKALLAQNRHRNSPSVPSCRRKKHFVFFLPILSNKFLFRFSIIIAFFALVYFIILVLTGFLIITFNFIQTYVFL
jgi:hypothetical protein